MLESCLLPGHAESLPHAYPLTLLSPGNPPAFTTWEWCVCVFVRVHSYMCAHVYVPACAFTCVYVLMCMLMCVSVNANIACSYVFVHVCVYVCTCVLYVFLCMFTCVFKCMLILYAHMCLFTRVFICVLMWYMCVCAPECVGVFACICIYLYCLYVS